jgi:hypothetical protein
MENWFWRPVLNGGECWSKPCQRKLCLSGLNYIKLVQCWVLWWAFVEGREDDNPSVLAVSWILFCRTFCTQTLNLNFQLLNSFICLNTVIEILTHKRFLEGLFTCCHMSCAFHLCASISQKIESVIYIPYVSVSWCTDILITQLTLEVQVQCRNNYFF